MGFSIVAAVSLVSFVFWELQHDNPIVDLKMFKRRSFAVANVLMLTLGVALFGSTVLLPQYLQVLMGYTAQQSGMALSPGGFAVILLLPLVGRLVSKVDARVLITFGFLSLSALALLHGAQASTCRWTSRRPSSCEPSRWRGWRSCSCPSRRSRTPGVPPQKYNQVSGIMNLSRNMGGDIGIAFVTTLIARRSQTHQANLAAHTTAYNAAVHGEARRDDARRSSSAGAAIGRRHPARPRPRCTASSCSRPPSSPTSTRSSRSAVATALMVPIVWLAKRPAPLGAPMGH